MLLALTACAGTPYSTLNTGEGTVLSVLSAKTYRADGWRSLPVRGRTRYSVVKRDGRDAIMAVGRRTASGLARRINIDPKVCRQLSWSWRVDQIQTDVDLRNKSKEDVAASVFLTFGDPGLMFLPNPAPTIRYVWTTDHMKIGEIFDNPFRPKIIRTIVVENRSDRLGEWVDFTRDIADDYRAAFGKPPTEKIELVTLFTDNDQSKQPVTAYYGPISIRCSE